MPALRIGCRFKLEGFPASCKWRAAPTASRTANTFVLPTLAYAEGKNLRLEAAADEFFVTREAIPLPVAERRIDRLLREILSAPERAIQVEAYAETAALVTLLRDQAGR